MLRCGVTAGRLNLPNSKSVPITVPTPSIRSKLPDVRTSIFTRIGRLAKQHGALNLAQGFPDFGVHPQLPTRLAHHASAGRNQYAPDVGVYRLRQAISAKKERLYGYAPDPATEITVTNGATEALFSTFAALLHPGDEVIYFEPAYDSYVPGIRLAGGIPIPIALDVPAFRVDWKRVAKTIGPRTRMIVINNPHNPSATTLTANDLEELRRITAGTDILVVSDEVYQHLIYDGRVHQSVLGYPELYARSVVAMSFGKTFHATGWRMGYALAPPAISAEIRRVHQFTTFSAFTPAQYALADHLAEPAHYLELPAFFQRKRDLFLEGLAGSAFPALTSAGTYFCCLDFSAHWPGSDLALSEHLIVEHGIAGIPLGEFYEDRRRTGLLRFCFAKEDEVLRRAGHVLSNLRLTIPT